MSQAASTPRSRRRYLVPQIYRQIDYEDFPSELFETYTEQPIHSSPDVVIARKARVERLVERYLTDRSVPILSASLRGPFDESWWNPWLSTRKRKRCEDPGRRLEERASSEAVRARLEARLKRHEEAKERRARAKKLQEDGLGRSHGTPVDLTGDVQETTCSQKTPPKRKLRSGTTLEAEKHVFATPKIIALEERPTTDLVVDNSASLNIGLGVPLPSPAPPIRICQSEDHHIHVVSKQGWKLPTPSDSGNEASCLSLPDGMQKRQMHSQPVKASDKIWQLDNAPHLPSSLPIHRTHVSSVEKTRHKTIMDKLFPQTWTDLEDYMMGGARYDLTGKALLSEGCLRKIPQKKTWVVTDVIAKEARPARRKVRAVKFDTPPAQHAAQRRGGRARRSAGVKDEPISHATESEVGPPRAPLEELSINTGTAGALQQHKIEGGQAFASGSRVSLLSTQVAMEEAQMEFGDALKSPPNKTATGSMDGHTNTQSHLFPGLQDGIQACHSSGPETTSPVNTQELMATAAMLTCSDSTQRGNCVGLGTPIASPLAGRGVEHGLAADRSPSEVGETALWWSSSVKEPDSPKMDLFHGQFSSMDSQRLEGAMDEAVEFLASP